MPEFGTASDPFPSIVQVIGVAYTYKPSLAVRRHLTEELAGYHSSQDSDFSYFYKGNKDSIMGDGRELCLRDDPVTGELARHWPEPELAVLLGERHSILAYSLANDLTAISIEARGRTSELDGSFEGKVWNGSGSLGKFIAASAIEDSSQLVIGLRIERNGRVIFDGSYSTSRRLRPFTEMPDAIVRSYQSYRGSLPPSKQIMLGPDDFLSVGTVIMLGTGLVVREEYFCQPADQLTVYCPAIGTLVNAVGMSRLASKSSTRLAAAVAGGSSG